MPVRAVMPAMWSDSFAAVSNYTVVCFYRIVWPDVAAPPVLAIRFGYAAKVIVAIKEYMLCA